MGGPQGKIAIVAWNCASHNKIHKTPTKCLDTSYKKSIKYAGATIEYSGYNGQNGNLGHEYVKIKGKSAEPLTIQAYAYRAGTAKVDYSWGPDKRECRRKKRAAKKAAKAKHDALIAAKKAMQEKDFKKVEKLYAAAAKNCAGAKEDARKQKRIARKQDSRFSSGKLLSTPVWRKMPKRKHQRRRRQGSTNWLRKQRRRGTQRPRKQRTKRQKRPRRRRLRRRCCKRRQRRPTRKRRLRRRQRRPTRRRRQERRRQQKRWRRQTKRRRQERQRQERKRQTKRRRHKRRRRRQ